MIISVLFLIISVHVIRKSSSSFDIAANFLTRNLGEGIKGPTINAIASSLPELLISSLFLFYFKDIEGFSAGYGTIIGSSAFNIAIIPVIVFLYIYITKGKDKVFQINKKIVKQDTYFLLGSILIMFSGIFIGIKWYWALFLILYYFIYIYYVINKRVVENNAVKFCLKKFIKDNHLNFKDKILYAEEVSRLSALFNFKLFRIFFNGKVNNFSSIIVVILSVIIIGASCYLLVLATESISDILGINLFIGAFIIAAIASSIPDTFFSLQDAKNDKFIDSFSNAYGSNIFDICIGIGLPVFIYTILSGSIDMNLPITRIGFIGDYILGGNLFIWSLIILFVFSVLVSLIFIKSKLSIRNMIFIFILYVLFLLSLLMF